MIQPGSYHMSELQKFDIAVIGAGPAGLAAAVELGKLGVDTLILDDKDRPGGKLVLVEYRAEDPSVPIKPLHKMTIEQIMKEFPANGFRLDSQFDRLPWQHMLFFARDEF